MKKIKVKIEGVSPLLMNKFSVSEVKSTRAKKVYDPKEEAERKTYRDSKGNLCLPSIHFKSAMVKAGTDFKMVGKKSYKEYCKSGIFIEPELIKLTPQEYTIHEEPVVIARARVMSWRPRFDKWSCEFEIEITDEMLNQNTIKDILESAGKYKGCGDHRPEFGRFKVTDFKVSGK